MNSKVLFFLLAGVFCLSACKSEGPAEKTGKKIDKAVEKSTNDFNEKRDSALDNLKSK